MTTLRLFLKCSFDAIFYADMTQIMPLAIANLFCTKNFNVYSSKAPTLSLWTTSAFNLTFFLLSQKELKKHIRYYDFNGGNSWF